MVKTKKNALHSPLVVTGYILYALLVVGTLISTTIPWGVMLFNPSVLHFNVMVFTIALTVGALLPALLGYIIGDHSVKSKSKVSHHFNGVLFGLLAFWLMTLVSVLVTIPDGVFTDAKTRMLVVNLIPSIGVAIVTTILAVMHVRSDKASHDILEYKPYSVTLIASFVPLPLWLLVNNIITNSVTFYSFASFAVIVLLGMVSYISLRKTQLSSYSKVVWAAVSVSVAFVAQYVLSQFVYSIAAYLQPMSTMEEQAMANIVGLVLALVAWGIYWRMQVKALHS